MVAEAEMGAPPPEVLKKEQSPVKPTETKTTIEEGWATAIKLIFKVAKHPSLNPESLLQGQKKGIFSSVIDAVIAFNPQKEPGIIGASYNTETGEYSFKRSGHLVSGILKASAVYEYLDALAGHQGKEISLKDKAQAKETSGMLKAHTEVNIPDHEPITWEDFQQGIDEGTLLKDDVEQATFQLVGKPEPEKDLKTIKETVESANKRIRASAKDIAEKIIKTGKDIPAAVWSAYGLALKNPAEDASKAFLQLAADLKLKFLADEKAPQENEIKKHLATCVVEVYKDLELSEEERLADNQVEEIIKKTDLKSLNQAILSAGDLEQFETSLSKTPELAEAAKIFKLAGFREKFCYRLFGQEEITSQDLWDTFAEATGLDQLKAQKKEGSTLGNIILLYYLYTFIKGTIDDLTSEIISGGGGGQRASH